jgi:hypothetical protein
VTKPDDQDPAAGGGKDPASGNDHPTLAPEEDAAQRGGDPDSSTNPVITPNRADPEQVKRVRAWLGRREHPSRQDGLWPYLLIRAFPGDTGVRQPPVGYFWESPDIRVYEGDVHDPSAATPVLNPTTGIDHTIFVHVWNLGRLPALGTKVRAWWANPSFSFSPNSPEPPHFIGGTIVNLGDRSAPDCHQLVRIEGLWRPVVENGGHECLLAVAAHVMDPGGADFWASTDRHVGQRNVILASPQTDLMPLLNRLGSVLTLGSDLQLLHGGADVAPILLAHKAVIGDKVTLPVLRDVVTPVPGLGTIGHLGTVTRTLGGNVVVSGADSVRAIREPGQVQTIDRTALLGGGAVPFHPAGPVTPGPTTPQVPVGPFSPVQISPARAVIEALNVRDLTAGSIAAAVSSSSGDGNLLRFQEVRDGVVLGGYSVIVKE